MRIYSSNIKKILTSSVFVLVLTACGGGGGGEFEPNYDENAMPQERRVDGELAFSSPSLMKMAESFRVSGDYTNAIRLYQRAANESPKHVTSRLALGQIYQRLGATDGAITYYRQVLELEPGNAEAELGLGQMLVSKNQSLEAVQYLEAAALKSPNNYRIYNSIGLAYDLEGLHEQAQNAYGRGLAKSPDHISLLNNLALSLSFESEYAPSIQLLSKAINLDYSQTTAQQNLIMVYAMSGEEEAARAMARTLMTPEEIEGNMKRYRWLASLSSKRRAQAIFLNLSSFPEDEIVELAPEVEPEEDAIKTHPTVSIDPKRQMLEDILNSENQMSQQNGAEMPIVADQQPSDAMPASSAPVVEPSPVVPAPDLSEEQSPLDPDMATNEDQYRLQLGSYVSEEVLRTDWERLKRLAPELLGENEVNISEVNTANNQSRYRLIIDQFDNFSAANEKCEALKGQQVPCLVLQN